MPTPAIRRSCAFRARPAATPHVHDRVPPGALARPPPNLSPGNGRAARKDRAAMRGPTRQVASLLDQSALTNLAESLVSAARKAGADAADAVAVRSVSVSVEVRDGAVEESERSESDDLGLRVFVGRKQAVVSTNDIAGTSAAMLAERAVA